MSLGKRDRRNTENLEPYATAEGKVVVYYEFPLGREIVVPGDKIRIKNRRGFYIFRRLAHNVEQNIQWIDCYEAISGKYHAVYPDKVKSVYRPKKSRAKKRDR